MGLPCDFEGGIAVGGRQDLVAVAFEIAADELDDVSLVVDDEDAGIHRLTIKGRPGRARPDRPDCSDSMGVMGGRRRADRCRRRCRAGARAVAGPCVRVAVSGTVLGTGAHGRALHAAGRGAGDHCLGLGLELRLELRGLGRR